MKVFQSIIYYVAKEEKAIPEVTIIQDVSTHVEENEEKLKRKLIRKIPVEYEDKLDDVVIVIRPF